MMNAPVMMCRQHTLFYINPTYTSVWCSSGECTCADVHAAHHVLWHSKSRTAGYLCLCFHGGATCGNIMRIPAVSVNMSIADDFMESG